MPEIDEIVVVGGGLAAAKAVEALRAAEYPGRVSLVSAEAHLPYERPPLSKGLLTGAADPESVFVHERSWYDEHDVELLLATAATEIDLAGHTVTTTTGRLHYDRLLLATGASPRRLPLADTGAPVAYLRTIEDSLRIRDQLRPGRRLVVVGGGWIGLEVAAAASAAGCDVVVVETLDLPLVRVLGPEVAQVVADLHLSHGVDLRTGTSVSGIRREGERARVTLDDGATVEADLVVVGVGVAPADGLAAAAGLTTDNGVLVDEHLRTSAPDVFAAGDVANAYHPLLGHHVRVEHWDNAIRQGGTAARTMLGADESYDRLPYFFTDQYDLGLEYVGHVGSQGYDEVVLRGDVAGRVFTAFWVKDSHVVAGMHVNDWDAIDPVRRVVEASRVDIERLRDPAVPLDGVVG